MSEPLTIHVRFLARDLNLPFEQVHNIVSLLEEGHPVPFIARYRKDRTENLDEELIRKISNAYNTLRSLEERKQVIHRSIESLGKLTPELDKKIRDAKSSKRLEDLYLPYKPKRRTQADEARDKGLEPLALNILEADDLANDLDRRAADFVDPDKKVASAAEALLGAGQILGEMFVEKLELRHDVREIMHRSSVLTTTRILKEAPTAKETSSAKAPPAGATSRASSAPGTRSAKTDAPAETIPAETAPAETTSVETSPVEESQERQTQAPERAQTSSDLSQTLEETEAATTADSSESESKIAESETPVAPVESAAADTIAENTVGNTGDVESVAETATEGTTAGTTRDMEVLTDSGSGGGEADVDGPVNSSNEPDTTPNPVETSPEPKDAPELAPSFSTESHSSGEPSSVENALEEKTENAPELSRVPQEQRETQAPETKDVAVPDPAPASETDPDAVVAEVARQFEEWKEHQKEKGIPVVRSQNQIKKKKAQEKKKKREESKRRRDQALERQFHDYFEFSSKVGALPPYRILAINRGEKIKALKVHFSNDVNAINIAAEKCCVPPEHPHAVFLAGVARDAVSRLLIPAFEREFRNDLTEQAENQMIRVFAKNLRNLLLQPPLHRKRVLAITPGYKHGCKLAALDEFGNLLDHGTIYLTSGAEKKRKAAEFLAQILLKYDIPVIAIGSGAAFRETEIFVSEILAGDVLAGRDVVYALVSEAGATAYAASSLGKREFPGLDPLIRATVSVGRRLQDPLNELVKIDPAALGVGMYQHDVKPKPLKNALNEVVETCVNLLGVDLNAATPAILSYVSGLNPLTAQRIYEYRREHGPFRSRRELLNVPGFGQIAFMHAAGFLMIHDGENPFDAIWIHPENYELAEKILAKLGFVKDDLRLPERVAQIAEKRLSCNVSALTEELGANIHVVRDVLARLARPDRDFRETLPPPIFRKTLLKFEDLLPGMELSGTVLNVVEFGAFVDLGFHDSGLIHISHMADRYIRDAHDIVSVGDIVRVWVLEIDKDRRRISLSLFPPGAQEQQHQKHERPPRQKSDAATGEPRPLQDRQTQDRRPDHRQPRDAGARHSGQRKGESGERRDRGDRRRRDDDRGRGRDRGPQQPKVYEFKPKEKEIKPITEAMKTGKEPLRGFGDLAQLFGRVQVPEADAAEKKRKTVSKPEMGKVEEQSENPEVQNHDIQNNEKKLLAPQASPVTPESTESEQAE